MGDLAVPWVIGWLIGHWSLSPKAKADRALMLKLLLIGLLLELLHLHAGLFTIPQHEGPLPPLWLLALWPLVATLYLHSMRWIWSWPKLGLLLMGSAGLLSYKAGLLMIGSELSLGAAILLFVEWCCIYWVSLRWLIPK